MEKPITRPGQVTQVNNVLVKLSDGVVAGRVFDSIWVGLERVTDPHERAPILRLNM